MHVSLTKVKKYIVGIKLTLNHYNYVQDIENIGLAIKFVNLGKPRKNNKL